MLYFSVLQLGLGIWAAVSLTKNTTGVKNTHWMKVEIEDAGTVWAGLTTMVVDFNHNGVNISRTDSWDNYCQISAAMNGAEQAQGCDDCKTASAAFHITAITNAISKVGQITTDATRSRIDLDVPCQKLVGLVAAAGGGISALFMLIEYADACAANMPTEYTDLSGNKLDVTTTYGPGFILTLFITIGSLLDGVGHALLPCPEDCAMSGYFYKRYGYGPSSQKAKAEAISDATVTL